MKLVTIDEPVGLREYAEQPYLSETVRNLQWVASTALPFLRDRRIWMVSSTAQGGGIAEILPKKIRLLRDSGLRVEWLVMETVRREFFALTKRIHNLIHGVTEIPGHHNLEGSGRRATRGGQAARSGREGGGGAGVRLVGDPPNGCLGFGICSYSRQPSGLIATGLRFNRRFAEFRAQSSILFMRITKKIVMKFTNSSYGFLDAFIFFCNDPLGCGWVPPATGKNKEQVPGEQGRGISVFVLWCAAGNPAECRRPHWVDPSGAFSLHAQRTA